MEPQDEINVYSLKIKNEKKDILWSLNQIQSLKYLSLSGFFIQLITDIIYDLTVTKFYLTTGRVLRGVLQILQFTCIIYLFWLNGPLLQQSSEQSRNVMKVMGGLQSERNQEEKESDDESDSQNNRRCSCWAKLKLTKSSRKIPNHKENYDEWRSVCKRIIYVHMIFQTVLSLH